MHKLLTCNNLTKKYEGDFYALNHVNLSIEEGKIYGLIGRNGAGKTTLLKLLANHLLPTEGNIDFDGHICLSRDYQHYFLKQKCSVLFALAKENYPNWDEDLFNQLIKELEFPTKKRYEKISRGNQNLMSIILALSSNAELILLDEPYTGLDPVNRKIIYRHVLRLNEEANKTFIISSHLVTELEYLLQDVIMIHKGELLLCDDLDHIKGKAYRVTGNEEQLKHMRSKLKVIYEEKLGHQITLYVYGAISASLKTELEESNALIQGLDLQDLMVALSLNGGELA